MNTTCKPSCTLIRAYFSPRTSPCLYGCNYNTGVDVCIFNQLRLLIPSNLAVLFLQRHMYVYDTKTWFQIPFSYTNINQFKKKGSFKMPISIILRTPDPHPKAIYLFLCGHPQWLSIVPPIRLVLFLGKVSIIHENVPTAFFIKHEVWDIAMTFCMNTWNCNNN